MIIWKCGYILWCSVSMNASDLVAAGEPINFGGTDKNKTAVLGASKQFPPLIVGCWGGGGWDSSGGGEREKRQPRAGNWNCNCGAYSWFINKNSNRSYVHISKCILFLISILSHNFIKCFIFLAMDSDSGSTQMSKICRGNIKFKTNNWKYWWRCHPKI